MNNPLKKILLVLALVSAVQASAPVATAGGDVVNNGGGLSENNILFAWVKLSGMIESCLNHQSCGLTVPEYSLLEKIVQSNRAEMAGAGIRFLSSKEHPEVFDLDESGAPRTGVTGSQVGSPIYFNIERLYPVVNGQAQPLDVLTAVGFLVHELGHHHGVTDHTYLDRLGGKVRNFIGSQRWLTVDLRKFGNNPFTVSAFFPKMLLDAHTVNPSIHNRIQVSVSNGYEVFDLSPLFDESSRCMAPVLQEGFRESSATDLIWSPLPAFDEATSTQSIRFQITLNWDCWGWPKSELRHTFNQTLEVSNDFYVKELTRKGLFDWQLVTPSLSGKYWRSQQNWIFVPAKKDWTVREVSCEKIDFSLNPLGPCDF